MLRDESALLFENIFDPWTGEVAEKSKSTVKSIIERADASGKDAIFKWYINVITPYLKEHAKAEFMKTGFKNGDTNNYPITCLLKKISLEHDIINENDKDKFTFEVWHCSL